MSELALADCPDLFTFNFSPTPGLASQPAVQAGVGVCLWCNSVFVLKSRQDIERVYFSKFCSLSCRTLHGNKMKLANHALRHCKYCSTKFKPITKNSVFCSTGCANRFRAQNTKCVLCGGKMISIPGARGGKKIKYCSSACKEKARRIRHSKNSAIRQISYSKRYYSIKEKVYSKYGNQCAHCSEQRSPCLSIDHVNGNGAEDRRETKGSTAFLLKVLSDDSGEYQILCMNCQWMKRHRNKEGLRRKPRLIAQAGL